MTWSSGKSDLQPFKEVGFKARKNVTNVVETTNLKPICKHTFKT